MTIFAAILASLAGSAAVAATPAASAWAASDDNCLLQTKTDFSTVSHALHGGKFDALKKLKQELAERGSFGAPILSNTSPEAMKLLHVNPEWVINIIVIVALGGVACFTACGLRIGSRKSASPGWVVAMLLASYLVLIPGLFSKDFSFNIAVNVDFSALGLPQSTRNLIHLFAPDIPERIQITQPRGVYGPIHESTRSFVGFLWQSDCRVGAVLVAIFAFGVPLMKLSLLGLGELWRSSKIYACAMVARWSILFVQMISKWAAPDMFAMILLYYLLRGLNHPPLLESLQVLDLGFTFYSVFCIFSVISTLAIRLPELPVAKADAAEESHPLLVRLVGRQGVVYVVACLFVAWAVFFIYGIQCPCLSLRLDQKTILRQFHVPSNIMQMVEPIINKLHLERLIQDDVSMWQCMWKLWAWFNHDRSLNLLLGFLMMSIFMVLFTVLDMIVLVVAAYRLHCGAGGKQRCPAMATSFVLKHLSFMDVLVVGVIVIAYAAAIYAEQGIMISLSHGIWVLAISEGIHYATYFAVMGMSLH
mmetsp:Transcript_22460/g.69868  ORF Transcript_22460/g.69868 Transcript_22460/m.69868 type:complete len:533 (-) Transcript_22460:45-1643(-)